ncbi:hypothetical protein AKJ58_01660 [candidate division MSBL1 archaeon SCGC-AAA385D11]|uniref:Uncharacterized protein n=1 Tax=candidate division MSBL1 archaeon SCGC-AAA385D11 TaxID=1698286 RepID=A0A133VMZ4_9EURY|nr:hypothetical protein AKJ58_01660 [candidate division MSBL1 archaeon SCGC-AAA385D11]
MIERWGGTMLMNEADFYNSDTTAEMVKILNEGFERSGAVIKAHMERQPEVVATIPFGPKILGTRKRWKDQALESRCITEVMHETEREDILPVLTYKFRERQQKLRNKLLMFRFKNYHKIDEGKIEDLWPEFREMKLDRRLIQATIGFSVLFWQDEEMFKRFKKFLKKQQKELKEERAASFDGGIVKAIYELRDIPHTTPGDIADHMEEEQNYKEVSHQKIGKHLKRLGLKTKAKKIGGKTERAIPNDKKQIQRVFKRYIPDYEIGQEELQ